MREGFVTGRLQRRHHLSITLVFTRSILDLTLPVTELLQGKEIDMADGSHLLDSLRSVILSKQNTVDEFHNNCYRIIFEMASKVRIVMKLNLVQLHFKTS